MSNQQTAEEIASEKMIEELDTSRASKVAVPLWVLDAMQEHTAQRLSELREKIHGEILLQSNSKVATGMKKAIDLIDELTEHNE